MQITYLYHSAFLIELEQHILLFDYVEGNLPAFDMSKEIVVFVTHAHSDHFSRVIFDLRKHYPNVRYILSDDIKTVQESDILFVKANEMYEVGNMNIQTLCSTDCGVAFLVKVEDKTIYHAGDLNWWDWTLEDTLAESEKMKQDYVKEIMKLKDQEIDVAMVPVDDRLGEGFDKGIDVFMELTNTKKVVPMHMWGKYEIIRKLENKAYQAKIVRIKKENESFQI
ncbi:MAG: MBL fold metallo-hydrolase [Longicatena sp.]